MGYLLFLRYFKIINSRHNNIIIIKGNFFRVSSSQIIGFDCLWDILIHNSNENMMNKFAKLLLDLCINFVDFDGENTQIYWKFYFSKLYEKLKEYYKKTIYPLCLCF